LKGGKLLGGRGDGGERPNLGGTWASKVGGEGSGVGEWEGRLFFSVVIGGKATLGGREKKKRTNSKKGSLRKKGRIQPNASGKGGSTCEKSASKDQKEDNDIRIHYFLGCDND